ncbi:hypothetical protein V1525DRAFT_452995 [Lipomyces kononenkoae]|uniref:Uncharacterized protein n=1 Tax=Lipomyces kononenkoae TaxID=34357 RepID=A0ACC3SR84_LIPKO
MRRINGIASSPDGDEQAKQPEELQNDYPTEAVSYFLHRWWVDGQYERWAEISTRKHVNLVNSTTLRVEGSHAALKVALTSSSGTLLTAGNKINRRGTDQSEYRSIIGSNETCMSGWRSVEVETANLCTAISRQALELVYAEVNKLYHSAEDGTKDDCSCAAWNRDLLPCRHRIQLGCPRGTRGLQTSAENVLNGADRREKVRRCGSCHEPGHNRRSRRSAQGIEGEDISVHDVWAAEDDKDTEDFHNDDRDATFELMWANAHSLT